MRILPRFAYSGQFLLENLLPGLRGQSVGSNLSDIDFSGLTTFEMPTGATIGGSSVVSLGAITSVLSTAFTVASTSTNYGLQVDESTSSAITGLKIKAAASGNGVALSALGGTNEPVTLDGKGTGQVKINTVSSTSGLVTIGNSTSLGGLLVQGPMQGRQNVLASSGNTTVTAGMVGSIMLLDGTSVTYTLPTPAVGLYYDFVSTVTSATTQKVITATASQFIQGGLAMGEAAGTTTLNALGNGTTHVAINMNGTTTGGIIGSWFRLVALSTTLWQAFGVVNGSGTLATPFATS